MAKVVLATLANLDNPTGVVAAINANFVAIAAAIEKQLSRDGTSPNTMTAIIDMNGNRVINLPAPVDDADAARHGDIQSYVTAAEAAQVAAELAETHAETAETNAEAAEASAVAALADLLTRYMGTFASAPTLGLDGESLVPGVLYYDSTVPGLRLWVSQQIVVGSDVVLVGGEEVWISYWMPLPMTTLRSLTDVNSPSISANDVLRWNAGTSVFDGIPLSGGNVTYTDGTASLDAVTVQDAIDEVLLRTSLGQYDISFWIEGLLEQDSNLFRMVAPRAFTLPATATGSLAKARVGPQTAGTILLKKNDVQAGTITWDAAETTGTFTVAGDVVFNTGDVLSLISDEGDTLFKDVAITLVTLR